MPFKVFRVFTTEIAFLSITHVHIYVWSEVISWSLAAWFLSSITRAIVVAFAVYVVNQLLSICFISCCGFLYCWLIIYVSMELLLDKRHIKRCDNVMVIKPTYVYELLLDKHSPIGHLNLGCDCKRRHSMCLGASAPWPFTDPSPSLSFTPSNSTGWLSGCCQI